MAHPCRRLFPDNRRGGSKYIALLNADGSAGDASIPNPAATVLTARGQPDGKILIRRLVHQIGTVDRLYIARLNADGTLDTAFTASAQHGSPLVVQPDGKIIVGGGFKPLNGVTAITSDGSMPTAPRRPHSILTPKAAISKVSWFKPMAGFLRRRFHQTSAPWIACGSPGSIGRQPGHTFDLAGGPMFSFMLWLSSPTARSSSAASFTISAAEARNISRARQYLSVHERQQHRVRRHWLRLGQP